MVDPNLKTFKIMFEFLIGISLGYFLGYCLVDKPKTETCMVNQQNTLYENGSLDEKLLVEVKILCLVLTYPKNHRSKAIHVKNTWGRKCTKLLFATTQPDPDFETLLINITHESRLSLCNKTRDMFLYANDHYLNDFDWFFKSDDDR